MSCMITYLLRIRNPNQKERIVEKIRSDIKSLGGAFRNSRFDIIGDFNSIAKQVADQALRCYGSEGTDISLNQPIIENLIVLLMGVTLKLNVLICGKPGTSKTLAVQIAEKILNPKTETRFDPAEYCYLRYFKSSKFDWIFGSTTTTSRSVQRRMDSSQASYLEILIESIGDRQVATLIFDEIGLAEMSPDNPLKALHSYLDNASEDRSEELRSLLVSIISKDSALSNLPENEK